MSGLEIPASIYGIVSVVAGSASAYKDMTRKGGEQSPYKLERISSNTVEPTTDVVFSSGTGGAALIPNGDMVASSSRVGSSAVTYSKWESTRAWKTNTGSDQSLKRGYKK
ncbi:hypothetical protein BDZ45DRAFT_747718 [Acephala macrosclerotiorum]|nr:hypothetical protein BDZ45DRAFT_747718 [Acephala macrosclerotiorum]